MANCPRCNSRGFESGSGSCNSCGWEEPILPPWVPSGWYYDPAQPGRERYWSVDRWVGKSKPLDIGKLVPTEPPDTPALEVAPAATWRMCL